MTTGIVAGVFGLLLVAGLPGDLPVTAERAVDDSTVRLRVLPHATIDADDMERARGSVSAVLATGGITVDWRDCSATECFMARNESADMTVLLLPITKLTDGGVGGEVTRDALTQMPTILVYVPLLAERVRAIHSSPAGRSTPALATIQIGHFVGAVIAHEVGHALGLPHGRSGVMKGRIATPDVLAMRRSRMVFSRKESVSLRSAMLIAAQHP